MKMPRFASGVKKIRNLLKKNHTVFGPAGLL